MLKDVTNSMDTNSTDIATKKVFCYCRQPESDEMIGCDNEQCKMEWFHFKCLKLNKAPKGKWYCPDCRKLDQFRCRKKSDKKVNNFVLIQKYVLFSINLKMLIKESKHAETFLII